jgi:cytoskeletal protein RodZ
VKIGETLRAAREVEGLTLEQVERQMRIRAKYLHALESERFDQLPEAYGRTFLREYARLLGIEPAPLVEEFDRRFGPVEDTPIALSPVRRRRSYGKVAAFVVLALVAASVGAWLIAATGSTHTSAKAVEVAIATPAPSAAKVLPQQATAAKKETKARRVTRQHVVLTSHGRCWIDVHEGSPSGPLLYRGFIDPGRTLRFARTRVWVRFGRPWTVDVRLNGKRVRLAQSSNPINVLFANSRALTA